MANVMAVGFPCRMWRVKAQRFLGWHRRRLRRLDLLEDDVRLFRHGGFPWRWRLLKGLSFFFSFFFQLFRVMVARVDVPIRPGGV